MCTAAGYSVYNVDLFNSGTKSWSTARLSLERAALAATSLGTLALFAGGSTNGALLYIPSVFICFCLVVVLAACLLGLSFVPMQVSIQQMLWTCTTVNQGNGRRLASA
jgi:hypothetical protein